MTVIRDKNSETWVCHGLPKMTIDPNLVAGKFIEVLLHNLVNRFWVEPIHPEQFRISPDMEATSTLRQNYCTRLINFRFLSWVITKCFPELWNMKQMLDPFLIKIICQFV
jgi:hypothetical protein